ncbi:MAG: NosD domain-containing protein [Methanothrix sp.]|uniref:right-handed parallel beta-helix repeat-containing protein n=2 Tax=Methanothrix sp. TaxID=90426 RepID=UPI003160D4DB|nr:NosD domain-containing protein [Methanothrix sp.]
MKLHLCIMIVYVITFASLPATAVTVCGEGCDFSSVQEAINAAHAGDTIEVHSGIYFEHVYISKSLTLIGLDTGGGMPVIDAEGIGSAITISADNVTLSGFKVTNSGKCGCGNAGINVLSNNNTITDNVAQGNKYGIHCTGSRNTFMRNNIKDNEISMQDDGKDNVWDAKEES